MNNQVETIEYDGGIYSGELKDGEPHGRGTLETSEGHIYSGEWKNGLEDGAGKITFPDGGYFEGSFKEGKRHGEGKFFDAEGELMLEGNWVNGELDDTLINDDNQNMLGELEMNELNFDDLRDDYLDLGDGMQIELVWLPAATFMMGAPPEEGIRDMEETLHEVTLSKSFAIGKYEVTQDQYEKVMGKNPSHFVGPEKPVDRVSWPKANEFCKKLSELTGRTVRLPTEAEWEFACRAGTQTPFSFGETITTEQVNFDGETIADSGHGEGLGETADVGSYSPNAFGLFDMHGNVKEWCLDIYDDYPSESVTDPKGPDSGILRVVRGGSWKDGARNCRSAYRSNDSTIDASNSHGFRIVVED